MVVGGMDLKVKKIKGGRLVLLVEDDEQVLEMLQQMLVREGLEVMVARNGKEALEIIQQRHPSLVVTDLLMPEMEGIELIRQLRKSVPELRIIAISGGSRFIDPYDQLRVARLLGADYCFSKPIVRNDFVAAVCQLMEAE